jgi:hypothetical protein
MDLQHYWSVIAIVGHRKLTPHSIMAPCAPIMRSWKRDLLELICGSWRSFLTHGVLRLSFAAFAPSPTKTGFLNSLMDQARFGHRIYPCLGAPRQTKAGGVEEVEKITAI